MDVHRDFAQVVALENERLRQLGRVKLDKESLTSVPAAWYPTMRLCWKQQGTHLPSFGYCDQR
jgi:hypothetical protein